MIEEAKNILLKKEKGMELLNEESEKASGEDVEKNVEKGEFKIINPSFEMVYSILRLGILHRQFGLFSLNPMNKKERDIEAKAQLLAMFSIMELLHDIYPLVEEINYMKYKGEITGGNITGQIKKRLKLLEGGEVFCKPDWYAYFTEEEGIFFKSGNKKKILERATEIIKIYFKASNMKNYLLILIDEAERCMDEKQGGIA